MEMPVPADGWFIDGLGRRLLLRGVNVAGDSKLPVHPDRTALRGEQYYDHRNVSFVGRPFPLDRSDEHFFRISRWGFSVVRLVVTWEAIEHGGPGEYDSAFLTYIASIVQSAARFGIAVIIDPHQDAWSRFSGGDGAPGWTLEASGFNLRTLGKTGAAIRERDSVAPLSRMIWATNPAKLASATMFTLFFGGARFLPDVRIGGDSAQEYLQEHYCSAFAQLAESMHGANNILGFGTMNEPSCGYIGLDALDSGRREPRLGASPTPLQSFALGDGISQRVATYALSSIGSIRTGSVRLNTANARAWADGRSCPFRAVGIWEPGGRSGARLLRPNHFSENRGAAVDFNEQHLVPFMRRFSDGIRRHLPKTLLFSESPPGSPPARFTGSVAAPHWYDGVVLMLGTFHSWLGADYRSLRPLAGARQIRTNYAQQLRELKSQALSASGGGAVLIGETGVPIRSPRSGHPDRRNRKGAMRSVRAMDRTITALDDALLSFILWNYTATHTSAGGDGWNGENLSIFSEDSLERSLWNGLAPRPGSVRHAGGSRLGSDGSRLGSDGSRLRGDGDHLNAGRRVLSAGRNADAVEGRALAAVLRPYARATIGTPVRQSFDFRSGRYELEVSVRQPEIDAARRSETVIGPGRASTDGTAGRPVATPNHGNEWRTATHIHIPDYHYPTGIRVKVSAGRTEYRKSDQLLFWYPAVPAGAHDDREGSYTLKLRVERGGIADG